jgi:hypothetical protein
MANCGLLLNDGTSFVLLNDGTSAILLNDSSCAFEPGQGGGATPPTTDGGGFVEGHRGSHYWRKYQEENLGRKKKKRKKKDALSELDELVATLRAMPEPEDDVLVAIDRALDISMANTLNRIESEVFYLRALLDEIDEEESILLLLH